MRQVSTKMNKKRLIVVLGMHRSGTSAITRGLQVLGVGLGDRLMPPVEGNNDKGFFEDIDLNALNVEILQALGSDWHYLSPLEASDVTELRNKRYFFRAVQLLRQKVGDIPTFGFKDPRVAKLLPFWKDVFVHCQFDVGYVLAVRHPLSVVKSLAKRDGLDSEKSYMLWLGHVLISLSNTEGHKRVLVDYDRLMQTPERELERIAEYLELVIDSKELQCYKSEFLDEGLRHTVYDLNDLILENTCPPLVREIYTDLLDIAADKRRLDDVALQNHIALWINEFERLKSNLRLVDRLSGQKDSLNKTVAERDGQIESLNQVLTWRDGHIAHQEKELTAYRAQADEYSQQVKKLQAELVSAQSHNVLQEKELTAYRAQADEYSQQVKKLQAELELAQSHNAHQEKELTAYRVYVKDYRRQLETLQQQRELELRNVRFLIKQLASLLYYKFARLFSGGVR